MPSGPDGLARQRLWSAAAAPLHYALLSLALRLRFGFRLERGAEFRKHVRALVDSYPGPVIWVANHCTLLDTWPILWAALSPASVFKSRNLPWSAARSSIYFPREGGLKSRLFRLSMYLGRGLPIVNEGPEEVQERSREAVFGQFMRVLEGGGSVFFFPEAGLSANGWFEPRRPKDFVGRLAAAVPRAAILCLYCRGEGQRTSSPMPARGETFRLEAELLRPSWSAATPPREIARTVFAKLGELQERWFRASSMPKNCGGNDVVDLKSPLRREHFREEAGRLVPEPEWLERHLTPREREVIDDPRRTPDPFLHFWKVFAAKEAAYKAFAQAGLETPSGAYTMLDVDLFRGKVTHRPTASEADVRFPAEDADKVHCVAVFRGGYIGDEFEPGDVLWGLETLPAGADPSEAARRGLLRLIADSAEDIRSPEELAVTSEGGIPKVLRAGRPCDWGVSLSHSGRFAAYSFIAT